MNTKDKSMLLRVIGSLLIVVLAAALIAPHLFNLLLHMGRSYSFLAFLRDIEFEGVASRSALVFFLLAIILLLRRSGMLSWTGVGFAGGGGAGRALATGCLVGVLSMAVAFALGWMMQAYGPRGASVGVGTLLMVLLGGLLVGFIEEFLFRGALYGLLRRALGVWGAACLSSLLFSLVHFAKPRPSMGVVHGHWDSGFRVLGDAMPLSLLDHHVFPSVITLFLMGLSFCLLYEKKKNLYLIIGLHAGWVWIIRLGQLCLQRDTDFHLLLFGHSESIQQSFMALIMVLVLTWVAVRALGNSETTSRTESDG